jgi:hypothetical protein
MKTSSLIKIGAGFIVLFLIVIQFLILIKIYAHFPENAIEKHYQVSSHVQGLLKTSCYDCHSNNTAYPGIIIYSL